MSKIENVIRKGISVLLILFFTTAIFPKRVWYDLLNTHHHHISASDDKGTRVTVFCDCDEMVAQSSFFLLAITFPCILRLPFIVFGTKPTTFFTLGNNEYSLLRGPPAL